jgi:hypothetical protein
LPLLLSIKAEYAAKLSQGNFILVHKI